MSLLLQNKTGSTSTKDVGASSIVIAPLDTVLSVKTKLSLTTSTVAPSR